MMIQHIHKLSLQGRKPWLVAWIAAGIGWGVSLLLILSDPVYPQAPGWAQYSVRQSVLAGLSLVVLLVHLGLAVAVFRFTSLPDKVWVGINNRPALRRALTITALLVISSIVLLYSITALKEPEGFLSLLFRSYLRFQTILWAIFFEALIFLLVVLPWLGGNKLIIDREDQQIWKVAGLVLIWFLLIWALMVLTGSGITPDAVGWGEPGIPLLFMQVLLVWIGILLLIRLKNHIRGKRIPAYILDPCICAIIWISAVLIWSHQPILRSYFTHEQLPPNFETYPFSDAALYDSTAQGLLLGNGFDYGHVIPRPLYILILAAFHAIAGQSYAGVIWLQTLLVAAFPVCLYLLGRELYGRIFGLGLASCAIIREVNSIVSTPFADTSTSKQLLSDLPTALAVAAFTWLAVRWVKSYTQKQSALLAGGALGITALMRTQALLIAPVILFAVLWVNRKNWRLLLSPLIFFGFGIALVFSPWVIRNYYHTGKIVLDDPATQIGMMASRYSSEMRAIPRLEGESDGQYSERLSAQVRQYILEHPLEVGGFVSSHFLHNISTTVLVLPIRGNMSGIFEELVVSRPFWIGFDRFLSAADLPYLLLNIFLLSLGLAVMMRRRGLAGGIPLLIFLAYDLSNAIARNSARRYILPVDWVSYFYYLAGLVVIGYLLLSWLGWQPLQQNYQNPSLSASTRVKRGYDILCLAVTGILLLLLGLSLPILEASIPEHFLPQNRTQLAYRLFEISSTSSSRVNNKDLQSFIQKPQAQVLEGRAFYPVYYKPNTGLPSTYWPNYKPYPDGMTGKLGFVLITGENKLDACLAMNNPSVYFPNARDVIVVGRMQDNCLEVLVVALMDGSNRMIISARSGDMLAAQVQSR